MIMPSGWIGKFFADQRNWGRCGSSVCGSYGIDIVVSKAAHFEFFVALPEPPTKQAQGR